MTINGKLSLLNGLPVASADFQEILATKSSVFETVLLRKHEQRCYVVALERHLERLNNGAAEQGFNVPARSQILHAIGMVVEHAKSRAEMAFKLRLIVESECWLVMSEPWSDEWASYLQSEGGIRAVSVVTEREQPQLKSTPASVSLAARVRASVARAQEALLVDSSGILREGAWSNFCWINRAGELITPATKILPGITRALILELARDTMRVREADLALTEILELAQEAFITQATRGVVPLLEIDGKKFEAAPGLVTRQLSESYDRLCNKTNSLFPGTAGILPALED